MDINFNKVTIIGVGLIGGSFALSLKRSGFKGKITGVGRKKENLVRAKKLNVIDTYTTNPAKGVLDADLIILATPVGQFTKIIKGIKNHLKKGAIVSDVGSVKARVVKELERLLPEKVSFIGTHPISGRECSGVESASADLFKNTRCIITPVERTNKKALSKMRSLWKKLGAKVIIMSPEEHDRIFASVSHLPHIIAYALINSIISTQKNMLHHGGKGLKDMTRIALSSPEMWGDICMLNKKNIMQSIDRFLHSLNNIKKLMKNSNWHTLEKEFQKAQATRNTIGTD
jgi:prephenate dehydrogenase